MEPLLNKTEYYTLFSSLPIQAQLMRNYNDQNFISQAQPFFNMMPEEILEMGNVQNNHGRAPLANGGTRPVTLLEHTQEVLYGQHGGFGLKTDLIVKFVSEDQASHIRACLRCAALFHDIGKKTGGREGHVERSVQIANETLNEKYLEFGIPREEIPVVLALIEYNEIFYLYTHGNTSIDVVSETLKTNYNHLGNAIAVPFEVYCQMLWALNMADSSTLRVVNEQNRDLYLPLLENVTALNMNTFDWLEQLRNDLWA